MNETSVERVNTIWEIQNWYFILSKNVINLLKSQVIENRIIFISIKKLLRTSNINSLYMKNSEKFLNLENSR